MVGVDGGGEGEDRKKDGNVEGVLIKKRKGKNLGKGLRKREGIG